MLPLVELLAGINGAKPGQRCPHCQKTYSPRFPSREAAMASEDMEAREQWISGICSNRCWEDLFGKEE